MARICVGRETEEVRLKENRDIFFIALKCAIWLLHVYDPVLACAMQKFLLMNRMGNSCENKMKRGIFFISILTHWTDAHRGCRWSLERAHSENAL